MKTDFSLPRTSYSPALIGFVALVIVLLASTISQQLATARFATLMLLAKKIERAETISADAIPIYIRQVPYIVEGAYCRSDIARAGLTIVLADLDKQNSTDDYGAWAAAMANANGYLRHFLSCSPADGNVWLRFAMVRFAIAAEPREIAYLMSQSANLAPAESNIVAARFTMWNRVNALTLQEAAGAVDNDLRVLLEHGSLSAVVTALNTPSKQLTFYVADSLRFVSTTRKIWLEQAGIGIPSKVGN